MSVRGDIENTLYQYSLGYDEAQLGLLADCFTEDAVVVSGEDDRIEGREAITALFAERRRHRVERDEQPRHVVTNIYIREESEDRATVVSYLSLVTTPNQGGAARTARRVVDTETSVATGWYSDILVREQDRWRIKQRRVHLDGLGFQRAALD
jgi:ketosteroid isomerase-like protein